MEQMALFWEDFLQGTEDANGHYTFRPSYSAENGWGDNASQDIEITTELLTNLIAGCELLGIKQDDVTRWKALLAKTAAAFDQRRRPVERMGRPRARRE